MLVDSHCHLDRLDLSPFKGDLNNALTAARNLGVNQFLCVAIDAESFPGVLEIAETHQDVWASVGTHPLHTEGQQANLAFLCEQARHKKVIAIGETGLDYFYAKDTKEQQIELFKTHVRAAVSTRLPLIVHTRDAREDTLEILRTEGASKVGGVLHCFTESLEMAKEAMEMGFYISFSGISTFNNAKEIREVVAEIPKERLLVETDSPYLTPVPHRGKPNSPQYVCDVARCLAEVRQVSYDELCAQTSENFKRLFFSK